MNQPGARVISKGAAGSGGISLGKGLALLAGFVTLAVGAADKKFIELGWDIPDTAFLRAHAREMEREGPFDGVIFRVEAAAEGGGRVSTESGWDRRPWRREWFEPALADLKACEFSRYQHNFIRFNATPKRLAWEDDEGWSSLAAKLRLCGWLAREGGVKGLAPDFEPYGENQWKYDPAQGRTFAETSALARRRGAESFRGFMEEAPQSTILALFLNSVVLSAGRMDRPEAQLARESYGLLPAFFNGILDAAPAGVVIVDGCESGYYMDSVEAYQRAALDMRAWHGPAITLVAPENRAKYRQQVQAGFGFYLDMFLNEPGHRYYRPPLEGSRLHRLSRNLRAARDAADEYVWVYGEQCRWWSALAKDQPWRAGQLKNTVGQGRAWEEAMPGITRIIQWARDPDAAAQAELAELMRRHAATNLLVNGDFREPPSPGAVLPQGWSAWQNEKEPAGRLDWDESTGQGAARAVKMAWGCFLQGLEAASGQVFVVRATCRAQGAALPGLAIRWQSGDRQWTREADDRRFPFVPGEGDWSHASGVVTVPPGVGRLVLLLDIRGQSTAADVCWFDDVELYRLDGAPF